jgi:hypothetical protein
MKAISVTPGTTSLRLVERPESIVTAPDETHVVSDPCRACILDYLHPLHRLSQVLCVQKIQIMIPGRKISYVCASGKLRQPPL